MNIETIPIEELKPADYNPRKKSEHVLESIKQSLKESGWLAPVVINTHPERKNIIIGGHRRLDAARELGMTDVPVIKVNLPLEKEKALNLRLNAQEEFEHKGLGAILAEIQEFDPHVAATLGFSESQLTKLLFENRYQGGGITGILQKKFLIPPFSILDAKQGYWQQRKKQWLELFTFSSLAESREDLLAKGKNNLLMRGVNAGVSVFDPVLSEVVYLWFLPDESKRILDPFAGSLSRGGVAAVLDCDYTGVEIRKEQIEVNEQRLKELELKTKFIHGDSLRLQELLDPEEKFDLVFTCPPYYDLEVYSDQEADLSAKQSYQEFMKDLENIYRKAVSHLKENRFVALVLGEIRDNNGFYRNFIGDHISMFKRLGFELYNEAIYVQMLATAPHRAERNMRKRKVVKTHQNLLTFYKGDPELLKNPRLLEVHQKVLTFFKGDPETIQESFKNPPPIHQDVSSVDAPPEELTQ